MSASVEPLIAPVPLRWRVWPVRDQGPSGWLAPAGALALCAAIGWQAGAAWGAAAAVLQAAALWRWLTPVTVEINSVGVELQYWRRVQRIAWRSVGRIEPARRGLLLWPAADSPPIGALRGVFVPCGARTDQALRLAEFYARAKVSRTR